MRIVSVILLLLGASALATPVKRLSDFELTDQNAHTRSYRFPKEKVTVMTVADHKGSDQLAPWIRAVQKRYGTRLDIDGVADVSMIPSLFHGMFREAFRKRLAYSVMLDWDGAVVNELGYTKGVANIYAIARDGRIIKRVTGSLEKDSAEELFEEIDALLAK